MIMCHATCGPFPMPLFGTETGIRNLRRKGETGDQASLPTMTCTHVSKNNILGAPRPLDRL